MRVPFVGGAGPCSGAKTPAWPSLGVTHLHSLTAPREPERSPRCSMLSAWKQAGVVPRLPAPRPPCPPRGCPASCARQARRPWRPPARRGAAAGAWSALCANSPLAPLLVRAAPCSAPPGPRCQGAAATPTGAGDEARLQCRASQTAWSRPRWLGSGCVHRYARCSLSAGLSLSSLLR